jgi:hypothetical protein
MSRRSSTLHVAKYAKPSSGVRATSGFDASTIRRKVSARPKARNTISNTIELTTMNRASRERSEKRIPVIQRNRPKYTALPMTM